MKKIKKRIISSMLAMVLLIGMIPMTAIASPESETITDEASLIAAIDAIPEGGQGEITLENINLQVNNPLNINNKDVTINLKNASLQIGQEGVPVIFVNSSNVTINAEGDTRLSNGDPDSNIDPNTCQGVIAVWGSALGDTYKVTLNGGTYIGKKAVFVSSNCEAVLNGVRCEGMLEAVDSFPGATPAKITIESGIFDTDVSSFVEDKWCGEVDGTWYVREKEYTDEFLKLLTNGKLVIDYVIPSSRDNLWMIFEDMNIENSNVWLDYESFSADFSKCKLILNPDTLKREEHVVDVVWNYDKDIKAIADKYIEKFPHDRDWFNVSDLEYINYMMNKKEDVRYDSLMNYSGELKKIFDNTNFVFTTEARGGDDDPFSTMNMGTAKMIHNGVVYYSNGFLGATAKHVIYVPESTGNTAEELRAAAQKRIDDYIGKGKVNVGLNAETVTAYKNRVLAEKNQHLLDMQDELDELLRIPEDQRTDDQMFRIMNLESKIQNYPGEIDSFRDSFEEGGAYYFLHDAEGEYIFDVTVKGVTELFIVKKDDTKLEVPTYVSVDLATDIKVSSDSSVIPLDTAAEVEKLTSGTKYDKIMKILNVGDNETFDIKLFSLSLNEYVTRLENGEFEVRIPISDKLKSAKNLIVYYVDENNKVHKYKAEIDKEGYAVFYTNHFSVYTLAAIDAETSSGDNAGDNPTTGDNTNSMIWITVLFAIGAIFITTYIVNSKKRNNI